MIKYQECIKAPPFGGAFFLCRRVQKWLALYSQGLETWSEWRRLGYPELEPGPAAVLEEVPRRLAYPQIEQSLNNSNRQEAIERQGDDNFTTRVWWDRN